MSPQTNRTNLVLAISVICLSVASTHAGIVSRFAFDGNAVDAYGNMNNTWLSGGGAGEETPLFSTDIPAGATTYFADRSIELGMNVGTAVSFARLGNDAGTKLYDNRAGAVAFWFKADQLLNGRDVVSNVGGFRTLLNNGSIVMPYGSISTVTASEWHYFTMSWDDNAGSGLISLDGQIQSYSFTAGALTDPARLMVGNFAENNTAPQTQFDGHFYDLQFYNRQLNRQEIAVGFANPGDTAQIIPEPSSVMLLGLGILVVAVNRGKMLLRGNK